VKYTRNEEFGEGKERRGGWKIKVVSVIPEIEWHRSISIEDVAQIHPRMNREELVCTKSLHMTGTELQAPRIEPALLSKGFQFAQLDGK
jgi:hypothetical protein